MNRTQGTKKKNLWDVDKSMSQRSSRKALGHRFTNDPELSDYMFAYRIQRMAGRWQRLPPKE